MIPILDEKIIQINTDTKGRLYCLTNRGNVYIKYDNYEGFELVAKSEIRKVIKPTFKKRKGIFNLIKQKLS